MSDNLPGNYEDWLTKQQAAQELGVAEKTIDRMAERKELHKATRRRTGLAPVAVFHPGDIAVAKERRAPVPFVAPPLAQSGILATGSGDTLPQAGQALVEALKAIADRVMVPQLPPPAVEPELKEPHFLTLKEARQVSGLPLGLIKSMAVKMGRFWRVPRLELERYAREYGRVSDRSSKVSGTVASA